MRGILRLLLIGWFTQSLCSGATGYVLTNAFPNLTLTNPVCMASPPEETNRLFIVEKRGRIVVVTNLAAPTRTIFMDIAGKVTTGDTDFGSDVGSETGFLGLAFHPGYATNGYFYVFYTGPASTTAGTGLHDILSRYQVSAANTNQGNPASEVRYLVQYDQAPNHNAGDVHFGPDGYLYVATGDEGGAFGNFNTTQRIDQDYYSAIMRIDVDRRPGNLSPNPHAALPSLTNYGIPADNPYVGVTNFNGATVNPANVRTEFWAVGMRNPWRFSFDSLTGLLYVGHVGQGVVEWVNIISRGANCGWNFYEGGRKYTNALPPGFVLTVPIVEYGHTNSRNCIIGGIVYRGSNIPLLYGAYLYADYGSGEVWALRHSGTNVIQNSVIVSNTLPRFTTFGEDPSNGDVLLAAARGGTNSTIERLVYPAPRITGVAIKGANLVLSGTNGPPSQTYRLLASTNVTRSSNWTSVATSSFDVLGNFALTNPIPANVPVQFFRLQLP
jgi:glucose/arabinose dehydrogenase